MRYRAIRGRRLARGGGPAPPKANPLGLRLIGKKHGQKNNFEYRPDLDFPRKAGSIRRLPRGSVYRCRAGFRCRLDGRYEREKPNPEPYLREAR
jgi:hypothetical protein